MTKIIAAIDNSLAAKPVLAMALALAPDTRCGRRGHPYRLTTTGRQRARVPRVSVSPSTDCRAIRFNRSSTHAANDDVVAVALGARRRATERTSRRSSRSPGRRRDRQARPRRAPECPPTDRLRTVVIAMEGSPRRLAVFKARSAVAADADLETRRRPRRRRGLDSEFLGPSRPRDRRVRRRSSLPATSTARPKPASSCGSASRPTRSSTRPESSAADLLALGWPDSTDKQRRGAVAREILDRS